MADLRNEKAVKEAIRKPFSGDCCGSCLHWENIAGGYCGKKYEIRTESYHLCKDHMPMTIVEFIEFPEEL